MRWRRRKFTKAIRGAVDFEPLLVASGQGVSLLQEDRFPGGPASPLILVRSFAAKSQRQEPDEKSVRGGIHRTTPAIFPRRSTQHPFFASINPGVGRQVRQGDLHVDSASFCTQTPQCLLDFPAPFGPALQLQTLAKRAPGKSRLVQADMKGAKLQKRVGVGFIDRQDTLDSLPRVIPAALKISLHGVSKEPVDFLAESLRMTQPDPP